MILNFPERIIRIARRRHSHEIMAERSCRSVFLFDWENCKIPADAYI